jgi:hypothetical protein
VHASVGSASRVCQPTRDDPQLSHHGAKPQQDQPGARGDGAGYDQAVSKAEFKPGAVRDRNKTGDQRADPHDHHDDYHRTHPLRVAVFEAPGIFALVRRQSFWPNP